jgi:carboxyl-terminal processing protease
VGIAEWMEAGLSALDPWTRPVWPAEISSWEADHAGVKVGVGLELKMEGEEVVVLQPLPDTPSWNSTIHQGDHLQAVTEGTRRLLLSSLPVADRLSVAEEALLGDENTTVTLTLQAVGAPLRDVVLSRASVVTETVEGYQRGPDNHWDPLFAPHLAYVHISRFRPTSEDAFDALLADLPLQGVLLDLRGNPGGDVNAAVQIADRFISHGKLAQISGRILPPSSQERDPKTGELLPDWNDAVEGQSLEGLPVVVLVDEVTASAAEVLAGALQELAGALIVGTPTWGKGKAQKIYTDPHRSFALQYTNFMWALPDGRRLSHELGGGIQPDLLYPLSTAEGYQARRLAAQRAALRVHADGTPMHWPDPGLRPEIPTLPADPQLLAAELLLKARLQ